MRLVSTIFERGFLWLLFTILFFPLFIELSAPHADLSLIVTWPWLILAGLIAVPSVALLKPGLPLREWAGTNQHQEPPPVFRWWSLPIVLLIVIGVMAYTWTAFRYAWQPEERDGMLITHVNSGDHLKHFGMMTGLIHSGVPSVTYSCPEEKLAYYYFVYIVPVSLYEAIDPDDLVNPWWSGWCVAISGLTAMLAFIVARRWGLGTIPAIVTLLLMTVCGGMEIVFHWIDPDRAPLRHDMDNLAHGYYFFSPMNSFVWVPQHVMGLVGMLAFLYVVMCQRQHDPERPHLWWRQAIFSGIIGGLILSSTLGYSIFLGAITAGLFGAWSVWMVLVYVVRIFREKPLARPESLRQMGNAAVAAILVGGVSAFLMLDFVLRLGGRGESGLSIPRVTFWDGPLWQQRALFYLVTWPGELGAMLVFGLPGLVLLLFTRKRDPRLFWFFALGIIVIAVTFGRYGAGPENAMAIRSMMVVQTGLAFFAGAVVQFWGRPWQGRSRRSKIWRVASVSVGSVALAGMLGLMAYSGYPQMQFNASGRGFSEPFLDAMHWLRTETPEDSIILGASQRVEWESYLVAQRLSYAGIFSLYCNECVGVAQERAWPDLWRGDWGYGASSLAAQLGIDYVIIDPWEATAKAEQNVVRSIEVQLTQTGQWAEVFRNRALVIYEQQPADSAAGSSQRRAVTTIDLDADPNAALTGGLRYATAQHFREDRHMPLPTETVADRNAVVLPVATGQERRGLYVPLGLRCEEQFAIEIDTFVRFADSNMAPAVEQGEVPAPLSPLLQVRLHGNPLNVQPPLAIGEWKRTGLTFQTPSNSLLHPMQIFVEPRLREGEAGGPRLEVGISRISIVKTGGG